MTSKMQTILVWLLFQDGSITFKLPAFYEHREITWNCYVDTTNNNNNNINYDLIIGRDLMHEIGINILFKDSLIE